MRRRDALRTGGVLLGTALAGCTLHPPTVADIVIDNRVHADRTVTITVTRLRDGERVLAETVDLTSSGRTTFHDPITESGDYRVSVVVADGPSGTYTWTVPQRADPAQLTIIVRSDSISFNTVDQ
ncbi:hypothetical protein [Halarchaeum sp. P4]|uniref:hypothetical protein n=1 Tax=Halarchaeum sp. P4 TaxID=3421639 RepID=UPI003EC0EC9E